MIFHAFAISIADVASMCRLVYSCCRQRMKALATSGCNQSRVAAGSKKSDRSDLRTALRKQDVPNSIGLELLRERALYC